MTTNIDNIERVIRIIGGLRLLSLLYFPDGNARWLGFNTCAKEKAAPQQ